MRLSAVLVISSLCCAQPGLAEGIKIIGKGSIKPGTAQSAPEAAPPAEAPSEDTAAPDPSTEAPVSPEPEPQAAPAGIVSASDPASIVAALQEYGVAARLETDEDGDPVIRTKVAGANSNVYFYGCDEGGAACRSIAFSAGFELNEPFTVEQANDWNGDKRFSKAYVNSDGSAQIEMDANMVGGISAEGFADSIDWWDYSVSEFKSFINW